MKWIFGVGLIALFFARGAQAQTIHVLTDRDLRAEYCLGVTTERIAVIDRIINNSPTALAANDPLFAARSEATDDADRLIEYLAPIDSLPENAGAFLGAAERAQADLAASKLVPDCPFDQNFKACAERQGVDSPALARIRSCNDLSWLPF